MSVIKSGDTGGVQQQNSQSCRWRCPSSSHYWTARVLRSDIIVAVESTFNLSCITEVKFMHEAKELKDKLAASLKEQMFLATTTDCWSTYGKSYTGVTVHWIYSDSQRKSACLALRRLRGSHVMMHLHFAVISKISTLNTAFVAKLSAQPTTGQILWMPSRFLLHRSTTGPNEVVTVHAAMLKMMLMAMVTLMKNSGRFSCRWWF